MIKIKSNLLKENLLKILTKKNLTYEKSDLKIIFSYLNHYDMNTKQIFTYSNDYELNNDYEELVNIINRLK